MSKDLFNMDIVVKSVRDEEFAFKPRKLANSEMAPLVTMYLLGLIGLGYVIFVMGAKWMLVIIAVAAAFMVPKISYDRKQRAISYSEYLSTFQDYELHQMLDNAMTLGLDKDTVSAIEVHLGIEQK